MRNRKLIPIEIEAYECPTCKAILYVSTPEKYISTFTKKEVMKHVRRNITPPLPLGLVYAAGSPFYGIVLDEGRMIQGTWNGEGLSPEKCYDRNLAHSYEQKVGYFDVGNKVFCDFTQKVNSKVFKEELGKRGNRRLLTLNEFLELEAEFLRLKKDPQKYKELKRDINYILSLDKIIKTTPELEKLVSKKS